MMNTQIIKYLVSASVLFLIFIVSFSAVISAPKNFPINTTITIEKGKAISFIALDLEQSGIIRSTPVFKVLALLFAGDGYIVAGDYFFDKPISSWRIATRLAQGDHRLETIKVTIPEGFNAREISDSLAKSIPDFDKDNFLQIALEKEGYLFPDTYFFYPNYRAERVIDLMTENFNKKINPFKDEIKQSGHTLNEIVIMASLIEEESGGAEDKVPISSILWKRLSIDLALQVDVAPETYDRRGLPHFPIANPGLDSILAALRPVETPYLFYLHDIDGLAHYAKNFEEHKANKVKYLNE